MRTIAAMICVAMSGDGSATLVALLTMPQLPFQEFVSRILASISEEPYREYWQNLGKFVHIFAQAESRLLSLLRDIAGTSEPVGGVLFSGTRLDAAKDTINRILDATGQSETKKRLERPLAQFSAIGTIRNNIIHWGASYDGVPDLLVSNAGLYPSFDKLKEFRINVLDLDNMCSDLEKINFYLLMEQISYSLPHLDEIDAYLQEPWLYTPPQPSPRKNQPPPKPQ